MELACCPFCAAHRAPQLNSDYRAFDDQSTPKRYWQIYCNPYLSGCGGASGYWDSPKLAIQQWKYTSDNIFGGTNA